MAEYTPGPKKNFSVTQKRLLGIAFVFWALYKFELSDPKIIKDMGIGYPWFIMSWLIVMFYCAGFSGWEFALYIIDAVKDKIKKPEQ